MGFEVGVCNVACFGRKRYKYQVLSCVSVPSDLDH